MSNTCIIDVGANSGEFLFPMAARVPSLPVIGIEPIPELFEVLETKAGVLNAGNVKLWKTAIDISPRNAKFNVAKHADWGVSSLLDFNQDSLSKNEYWTQRSDLYFEDAIDISVQRLDKLIENSGYDHVSFIKIDAQGVDLRVLESLGKYLSTLDGGMLETPTTRYSALYNDEPTLLEALEFLRKNNFQPYAIKPNDPSCAEVNIFFHRNGIDWEKMEDRLMLRGIPIYDGKHYWHVPSSSALLPATEAEGLSIQSELRRARHLVAENAAAWTRVVHWEKEVLVLRQTMNEMAIMLALNNTPSQGSSIGKPVSNLGTGLSQSSFLQSDIAEQIEFLKNELIASREEALRSANERDMLQRLLDETHISTSWRLTAPVRAAKRLFRK